MSTPFRYNASAPGKIVIPFGSCGSGTFRAKSNAIAWLMKPADKPLSSVVAARVPFHLDEMDRFYRRSTSDEGKNVVSKGDLYFVEDVTMSGWCLNHKER